MRLGGRGASVADGRWASAAAAFALVASFMMFTFHAGVVESGLASPWRIDSGVSQPPLSMWLPLAGWTVTVVLAYTRFRLVAAAAAWAAALCEIALALRDYPTWPTSLVESWWMLALGVGAALALTTRNRTRPRGGLGRRRTVAVSSAFAALAALPTVEVLLAEVTRTPDGAVDSVGAFGGFNTSGGFGGFYVSGIIATVFGPILVLTILICLLLTAAPVRRRLLVLFAPALALNLLVPAVFHGFLTSTQRFDPPVLLVPGQWVFLAAFPVLLFLAGAVLVERGERRSYLVELGRAAEREARLRHAAASS